MKQFLIYLLILTGIFGYFPEFVASGKKLPVPGKKMSVETLVTGLKNFTFSSPDEILYPSGSDYIVRHRLANQPPPDNPFSYTEKIFLGKLGKNRMWLLWKELRGYLLLDGERLEMHYLSESFQRVSVSTLWYDRILPPRDRGGEAPDFEIAQFRRRFLKRYSLAGDIKLTGIVRVPGTWYNSRQRVYLLSTRVSEFPVVLLECRKKNPGQCHIKRGCFTERVKTSPEHVTGIAVEEKTRRILLGDREHKRIEVLRFNSCADIVHQSFLSLPARLKKISAIALNSESSLFVATRFRDDYFNAGLFSWPLSVWSP